MKKIFFYLLVVILFSSCRKSERPIKETINDNPSYYELEDYINNRQNKRAVFPFSQYKELLTVLQNDKFIVLPLAEFKDSINNDKIMIGLRHDVDCHPFKAVKMANIEHEYNFRSTYYFLATAEYYGKFYSHGIKRFQCMEQIYENINDLGHEVGVHNDLLAIMINYKLNPFQFNKEEFDFYRSIGITIKGTSSHGSDIARRTVPNYQIFSDFAVQNSLIYKGEKYLIGEHSLFDFGFQYEAYHISYNKYYSEPGGVWNIEGGFGQVIQKLEESVPGDRIQILTHPEWWGKQ